ncbi:MAG TPA: hypothetical protein VIG33_16170 [Pseudobdellovibrionaceae bacterium]
MQTLLYKVLVAFGFLFSIRASADILFVDLNNSIGEIQTVTALAAARGEKLVITPQVDASKRIAIKKKQRQMESLVEINQALSHKKQLNKSQQAVLKKNYDKVYELKIEIEELLENTPPIEQEIQETFDLARQSDQKFSSMIVSGHHSIHDENLGIINKITDNDFLKILNNNKDVVSGIKAIYLWGCYTATKDRVYFWKKGLPEVRFLAGFQLKAPGDGKALNHDMLEILIRKETMLVSDNEAQNAPKNILEAISSIPNVKLSSAALFLYNYYVDSSFQVVDVRNENCAPNVARMMKLHYNAVVQSYLYGHKDIPEDTSSSPLRMIYEEGQQLKHCQGAEMAGFMAEYIRLLKLIKFPQVSENFFSYYKEDLAKMKDSIQSKRLPVDLEVPNSSDSRPKIFEWIKKVSQFAADPKNNNHPDIILMNKMSRRLQNILGNLNCITTDWIEDYGPARIKSAIDEPCAEK